ncbi:uncharacterized protein LOC135050152 isoform X1 [Pseudophryne corroboree]|uniref:uncharacterized protein LOC135050152 isoform X1 n=1 Tax=Pseudophryne corroboree TaxID=495146 RepID=UPI003081F913
MDRVEYPTRLAQALKRQLFELIRLIKAGAAIAATRLRSFWQRVRKTVMALFRQQKMDRVEYPTRLAQALKRQLFELIRLIKAGAAIAATRLRSFWQRVRKTVMALFRQQKMDWVEYPTRLAQALKRQLFELIRLIKAGAAIAATRLRSFWQRVRKTVMALFRQQKMDWVEYPTRLAQALKRQLFELIRLIKAGAAIAATRLRSFWQRVRKTVMALFRQQ